MILPGFRDDLFAGKTVLITGASRGIGLATAQAFAACGARVGLVARDQGRLTTATRSLAGGAERHRDFIADVSNLGSVKQLADRVGRELGPVDVIVNNAGTYHRMPIGDAGAPDVWRATLSVNADGAFHVVHAFLDQLRAQRGAVVNVVSIRAFTASRHATAYSASKGALVALTKGLASELAPHGIRVNAVAPNDVRTSMSSEGATNAQAQAAVHARTPISRLAEPEEIAAPIVFLASPLAAFVTGTVLLVDGGFLAT